MKIVTSIGLFNDAIGKRMSITYSEINEQGQIVSDNKRVDRVLLDTEILNHANALTVYAQTCVDSLE